MIVKDLKWLVNQIPDEYEDMNIFQIDKEGVVSAFDVILELRFDVRDSTKYVYLKQTKEE
jgi:hypothetical protein